MVLDLDTVARTPSSVRLLNLHTHSPPSRIRVDIKGLVFVLELPSELYTALENLVPTVCVISALLQD